MARKRRVEIDDDPDEVESAANKETEIRDFVSPPSGRLIVKRKGHSITRQIPKPIVLIDSHEKIPFDFSRFPNLKKTALGGCCRREIYG